MRFDLLTRAALVLYAALLFLIVTVAIVVSVFFNPAHGHVLWADGSPVPVWVARSCCGEADAHVLGPSDYWLDDRAFHIVGIRMAVPLEKVLPSQDGKVWAFYASTAGENANVYCVFYSGSI